MNFKRVLASGWHPDWVHVWAWDGSRYVEVQLFAFNSCTQRM